MFCVYAKIIEFVPKLLNNVFSSVTRVYRDHVQLIARAIFVEIPWINSQMKLIFKQHNYVHTSFVKYNFINFNTAECLERIKLFKY